MRLPRLRELAPYHAVRASDGLPVLRKPHGAEKAIAAFFNYGRSPSGPSLGADLLDAHIRNKRVLVVPAYSTNPFLFSALGAREVVGADNDPNTINWLGRMRDHFGHQQIGRRFLDLLLRLPFDSLDEIEGDLRSLSAGAPLRPLRNLQLLRLELGRPPAFSLPQLLGASGFDFVYVPYLFGIGGGLAESQEIYLAFHQLASVMAPRAALMVTPFPPMSVDAALPIESFPGSLNRLPDLVPRHLFELIDVIYLDDCGAALLRKTGQ